jgi:hypothetical protein
LSLVPAHSDDPVSEGATETELREDSRTPFSALVPELCHVLNRQSSLPRVSLMFTVARLRQETRSIVNVTGHLAHVVHGILGLEIDRATGRRRLSQHTSIVSFFQTDRTGFCPSPRRQTIVVA